MNTLLCVIAILVLVIIGAIAAIFAIIELIKGVAVLFGQDVGDRLIFPLALLILIVGVVMILGGIRLGVYEYQVNHVAEESAEESAASPDGKDLKTVSENPIFKNTVSGNSSSPSENTISSREEAEAKAAAEKAKAEAEKRKTEEMLKEQAEAEESVYAEEDNMPAVHIDNSTYREYEKLYSESIAYRGVRSEMTDFKTCIAKEIGGYNCTDGPAFPLWSTDWDFYNQLSGSFPVTLPELQNVDLKNVTAVRAAIKQHETALKKAWGELPKAERISASEEEYYRRIYNCPEEGVAAYDQLVKAPNITANNKKAFDEAGELIETAYSEEGKKETDPIGVDYFLVYNSHEYAEEGLDQYSHTSKEYRQKIAVPMIAILKQMDVVDIRAMPSSWNLCRPPVARDSLCRLVPADYQENREALIYETRGKMGNLITRLGINTMDNRQEYFAQAKKKTENTRSESKEQSTPTKESTQVEQPTTENPTTDNPEQPDDDDDDDDEPEPGIKKDPAREPKEDSSNDNDDNSSGGDQNHDEANDEEDKDNKDNNPSQGETNPAPSEGTGDDTQPSDGNDGNHDTGGDTSPIEDTGSQGGTTSEDHGDGTSTERPGETGGNGDKDSSSGVVDDF